MEANENRAFDALSDRVRRRILAVLGESRELSVGEIVDRIDSVGRSTISTHLRVLRQSGLVRERRAGRQRFYSVDADGAVRDAYVYLQSILRSAVDDLHDVVDSNTSEGARRLCPGAREVG